ncbi:MAG: phosphoglycerate kinase [Rickettsiales bacterium]
MKGLRRLEDVSLKEKTVLVRVDINVPMQGGKVTDNTRIVRLKPTIDYLLKQKCKIVLLSHFDRPKGKFVPSMSLAPLVDALSEAFFGKDVKFGVDCVGSAAKEAVSNLSNGDILLLENLRFHPQEESGDDEFARELASLGDVFVNEAFSCSHRAHASMVGIPKFLLTVAGRLMQEELEVLDSVFSNAEKPVAAIIGGSKVSTKLELLENLSRKMDKILIGGAMANVFINALGYDVGKSLCEAGMKKPALSILDNTRKNNCKIILPVDLMVAKKFAPLAVNKVARIESIPKEWTAVDIGPESVRLFVDELAECKTIIWNGPVGAFETSPFDVSTFSIARSVASFTESGNSRAVAGGGDTVAALTHCGVIGSLSYVSTAGGAFLEWLEGKVLPGVAALVDD